MREVQAKQKAREIVAGEKAQLSLTITDEMVRKFAELTGDSNPIHLDDAYAAKTRFGKRVAHGMLVSATLSRIAGMDLPGPGTIVMGVDVRYKAPCYIGDRITGELTIVNVRKDKPIIKARYTVVNQNSDVLIEGDAILYYDPIS